MGKVGKGKLNPGCIPFALFSFSLAFLSRVSVVNLGKIVDLVSIKS